ncbi:unnamed protein product, partial [Polarella glacialis]
EVGPRVGMAGFAVASVTIERTASQVVKTSQGRLPLMTLGQRWGLYRATIGKHVGLMFLQYSGTREMRLALDQRIHPALSVICACGLMGVPCSSLQYNWAIQDTYRHFQILPPASTGPLGFLRQKVAPGLCWCFIRAGCGTGGALYFGPSVTAQVEALGRGLLPPPANGGGGEASLKVFASFAGGLTTGALGSLATQWVHNITLVAGRMAALGEVAQAPHYTTIAARAAWNEMGISLLYMNFPQRMVINAVTVGVLNACDIFRPLCASGPTRDARMNKVCKECGLEDASEGGGRYGTDDHEGLFFCGRCWQSWDEAEKENIMRPLHQQRRVHPKAEVSSPVVGPSSNFFDSYQGGEGADDTEGAWSPSDGEGRRAGALELVGALERPRCVECSNEEGEEGGGRYGHGADAEKFFCGRCWQSWDEEDRRKMMMAYAPGHMDRFANEPSVGCPPPDPPSLEDDFGFDFDDEGDDDLDEYGELDENLEAEEGDAGAQEDSS